MRLKEFDYIMLSMHLCCNFTKICNFQNVSFRIFGIFLRNIYAIPNVRNRVLCMILNVVLLHFSEL